jgi:phosphomannomutase
VVRDLGAIVKAYDVRGLVPDELDAGIAREIGAAFAEVLGYPRAVVVGRDMRTSSPELAAAFTDGVIHRGVDVIDLGLTSTDELYFASGWLDLPGAMITASHNPPQYGGIKVCRAGAAPISRETGLEEIRARAERALARRGQPDGAGGGRRLGTVRRRDVLPDYAAYLRRLVDVSPTRRLKVVVDAGNGMAGLTVPAVFADLQVELVPLFFELDGTFPHHDANPIKPENLRHLQATVRETGADVGLAFDGDADRCWFVDEHGRSVSPSTITALIAVRELAREPGATIVHNLITSRSVPEIVREHGGVPVRERVGHSFIKATMARTGAIFGGEHSAHFYFRDFWRADSGLLAALHVLAALGSQDRPLSELLSAYERYVHSGEINSVVEDQASTLARIKDAFVRRGGIKIDELDGLTVEHDSWWFNVRASNTEPVLRLNAEGTDRPTMERIRDEVLAMVRAG